MVAILWQCVALPVLMNESIGKAAIIYGPLIRCLFEVVDDVGEILLNIDI